MFSQIFGRMPFARSAALILACQMLSASADAQQLTPPQPGDGTLQVPNWQNLPQPQSQMVQNVEQPPASPDAVVHRIKAANERMELTVNSSRVLSLDQNIPRAQVNNKEILELTPLSPNEIQVAAKKAGVTQINLWTDKGQIYTVDCIVYGDARELQELLKTEFPSANLKVRPMQGAVLLTGFVDRADTVTQIIQVAQDYYPKVLSNIQVGGVQQILLHVKVAEVSRSKMRNLGFDFAAVGSGGFVASSISSILSPATLAGTSMPAASGDTVRFGVVDGNTAFFGFLDALRQDDLLKILADPTLTTVSGRPAQFKVGGEIPYPANATLNGVSISYKDTGITVDFVPIVLGNGNIRLEVRPIERELDETRSFLVAPGVEAPAFTLRQVDTGAEMRPGQTLAIAGLVQKKLVARSTRIPWLGDMPYLGAAFRHTRQKEEEIELLFLVTPEVVAPLDCYEVPQCLPGMHTDVPNDCGQYWKGYIEVPTRGPCGPNCGPNGGPMSTIDTPPGMPDGNLPFYETVPAGSPTPARPAEARSNTRRPGGVATASATRPLPAQTNPQSRYNASAAPDQRTSSRTNSAGSTPGFIGPVGYDVLK
jgi:pilus assembly protein CpaC